MHTLSLSNGFVSTFALSSAPGPEPQCDLHLGLPAERRPQGSQRSECPESDLHCDFRGLGGFLFKIIGVLVFERHWNILSFLKKNVIGKGSGKSVPLHRMLLTRHLEEEGGSGWMGPGLGSITAGPLRSPMRDQDACPADLRPLV